jgi:hypothetical protein
MMIIAILASMSLFTLYGVMEDAREARTQAQVAKLHELLMEKWEQYPTRPVPIQIVPGTNPAIAAKLRLYALRELMRMELPDRITDVTDNPVSGISRPALSQQYQRRASASWTTSFQGAECLYLIVSSIRDGDSNGLDFFKSSEIGDLDGDGVREILDAWGNPIEFVRWPAGLDSPLQPMPRDVTAYPDPFDPLRVDPRWSDAAATIKPFAMFPLIYSPGRDRLYDIVSDLAVGGGPPMHYATLPNSPPNVYGIDPLTGTRTHDPYCSEGSGQAMGQRMDANGDGTISYFDNITNHFTGNQ